MKKDLYEILGLANGKSSSQGEVRSAFRKRATELHPDKVGPGHEAEFSDLKDAYAVLSDPELRARYDRGEDVLTTESEKKRSASILLEKSVACFEMALQKVRNPRQEDVAAIALGFARDSLTEARTMLRVGEEELRNREALLGRAMMGGEIARHVQALLQDRIKEAQEGVAAIKRQIEDCQALVEHMKKYSWKVDEPTVAFTVVKSRGGGGRDFTVDFGNIEELMKRGGL